MDEEKFSIDRFLELMGERDGTMGLDASRLFHVEHSAEATEVADEPARRVRSEVGEGLAAASEDDVRRSVWDSESADEASTAPSGRASVVGECGESVEDAGAKSARGAKPRESEPTKPVGVFGRLVARLLGVRTDEAAAGAHGGVEKSADDGAFAGGRDAGLVVADEGAQFDEASVHRTRKYRAEEPVWRGEVRSAAEVGESVPSGERPRVEKRIFAENYADSAENRGKIAEFRKSDSGGDVDIRAISRAIERDVRRY